MKMYLNNELSIGIFSQRKKFNPISVDTLNKKSKPNMIDLLLALELQLGSKRRKRGGVGLLAVIGQ